MGYDLDTMQKFSASVAAGPKALPVLVLTQEGKFNIDIFNEEMHEKNFARPWWSAWRTRPSRWASSSR